MVVDIFKTYKFYWMHITYTYRKKKEYTSSSLHLLTQGKMTWPSYCLMNYRKLQGPSSLLLWLVLVSFSPPPYYELSAIPRYKQWKTIKKDLDCMSHYLICKIKPSVICSISWWSQRIILVYTDYCQSKPCWQLCHGSCGSVYWAPACEPKGPGPGTCLGYRPGPQLGVYERPPIDVSLIHWFFSPSLTPPCLSFEK